MSQWRNAKLKALYIPTKDINITGDSKKIYLLAQALEERRNETIKAAWTRCGKIFMKETLCDKPIQVRDR
ncbi:hypothetical protein PR048_000716 [Dryococelus australis]|uniref:Uncharacterized protein n=1 Tax=Dryococelus australis TaxID=614101 RepID=A0ABQ9IFD7_9NEOP|nr:hypothetical protein PR048_000716 [Dryococelus australis]